ncbi:HAMP domain-containing sensor histidine kinase [Desulfobacter curvatus]|uniref:HAMP domain-containing sensor histidine kinase n=1 Tax=Desulfobacter curvatus TaxID=2290 RepID=UPI00037691D9|nr:HAMP domain-containing sensor histidine kinase [Desulfobacter curvatus]
MITKRLYLKILCAFLGILLINMLLTIGLFMVTAGRSYKSYIDRQTIIKLKLFKVMVQNEADRHRNLPAEKNPDFVRLLDTCTQIFGIKLWLTEPGGHIIWQSFEGSVDFLSDKVHIHVDHDSGITVYHYMLKWEKYYAIIPISYRSQGLHIHLFVDTGKATHYEKLFLIGFLVVGITTTLMLIPMISYITRRINRLNQSALEFAEGNLSVRTDIKGHDEIAKLGDTFNLMADRLERLVGNTKELTANVSHELRSPLARLRVSKELILDKLEHQGFSDDAVMRLLNNMESDIGDLDTLIAEALALSKMNYQESALAPETFRFCDFIKSMLDAYHPLLSNNGLALDLNIRDFGKARQDKALVKSVFSNLMDNAIKYSPPGNSIRVSAGTVSPKGLEFSITNTCAPMSQKDLDRLFNPFFRIPGQKASGTGLGLAIAKKQVLRCKGNIHAEHTGRTICLTVSLP